jgi:hypothetical protein
MTSIRVRSAAVLVAALGLVFVGCSDDDADSISSEAQQQADRAQEQADDLKDEVQDKLDEAGETADETLARGQAELFRQQVTDLGQDDTPSVAVTDLESAAADLPADPDVTGIEDSDGDGDDDDGKVQITVDDSSACVTISGASVDVTDGEC